MLLPCACTGAGAGLVVVVRVARHHTECRRQAAPVERERHADLRAFLFARIHVRCHLRCHLTNTLCGMVPL
jgi:hypothetical protein